MEIQTKKQDFYYKVYAGSKHLKWAVLTTNDGLRAFRTGEKWAANDYAVDIVRVYKNCRNL